MCVGGGREGGGVLVCKKTGLGKILLTLNHIALFVNIIIDIHLSPNYNQSPCTETHLLLRVNCLPSKDQDPPLTTLELSLRVIHK